MMILLAIAQAAAEGEILLPSWLITILITMITALITSVGVMAGTKANLETRTKRNEEDIKELQDGKVSKSEFGMVYDLLLKIDRKLDDHIKEG